MIRFNLKLAIRNLAKNKVYSFLIIGGFAIGFAACLLIGLFYQTETSVNEDFVNHKQIYRLYDVKNNRFNLNYNLFPILTENYPEVKDACPLEYGSGFEITLRNDQTHANTLVKHILSTTNNFFDIFSVDIVASLSDNPFSSRESIVLTSTVAKKLFGAQNPLGQSVNINNFFTGTVTAIINDLPTNSTLQAEVMMNSENEEFRLSSTCNNGVCYNPTNFFVLLKEGTDTGGFTDKLNGTIGSHGMDVDSIGVQNLADIYLSSLTMKSAHLKGNPKLLKIFLAIAVLIILLSSINYLNYSISIQYAKLKEIGINKTNGASWKHLVNYSFTEVSLGIFISMAISVLITLLMLPYTSILFGRTLIISIDNLRALAPVFTVAIFGVILLNSLAPIYILSKFKVTEFLSGFRGKRNRSQIGKQVMLTFQFTASIALIAVVMIIFKQLNFVQHSDLGYDKELLVRINLPNKFQSAEAFKQETEKLQFVKSSAISFGCPGMINMRMGSNTGENSFNLNCISIGDDYLKTMGIALLEGREFNDGDAEKVCLINQEAKKQYQWENIEGKRFDNGQEGGYEVVGVINDFNVKSFHTEMEPLVLLYSKLQDGNVLSVKLTPGNIGQQMDQIKEAWKKFSPYDPLSFTFYDDQVRAMYAKEEKLAKSITFFSFIAIVLTCMGILGQIFLITIYRTKEIGIRKINGAKVSEVLVLLNRDFVKWVAIAFIIATPLAWFAMHKWLENFAYKTELSWWIFALAGLLALGIALLTVSWQSWRAATRNPVEALRYE